MRNSSSDKSSHKLTRWPNRPHIASCGSNSVNYCAAKLIDNIIITQTLEHSNCERFEPRSHFKSRLSLIVRVNVVLNRTVVVDSDWRFDNLCSSHLQSQSELYDVSWCYYTLVIDLIGQLGRDVIVVHCIFVVIGSLFLNIRLHLILNNRKNEVREEEKS